MDRLVKDLALPESAASVKTLSLGIAVERVARWTALYGARLGVTQAADRMDPAAVAVDAWHTAWADLLVEVYSKYKDASVPEQVRIRQMLLSPYDEQAKHERTEEVKAQTKRRKAAKKADDSGGSGAKATLKT